MPTDNCRLNKYEKNFLIGNPNSGKTSLFNAITGKQLKVGNWPGVTVNRMQGLSKLNDSTIAILDLPGTYSLSPATPEEAVVTNSLAELTEGIVINVVDTGNLERNLFLTTQLVELGIVPMVALNCYDTFTNAGGTLDLKSFESVTGLTAFPTVARTGIGTTALIEKLHNTKIPKLDSVKSALSLPEHWKAATDDILKLKKMRWNNSSPTERNDALLELIHSKSEKIDDIKTKLKEKLANGKDIASVDLACELASDRYRRIEAAVACCSKTPEKSASAFQDKIDAILTNRYLGLPIFALLMAWVFWTTFTVGAIPMEWMEAGFDMLSSYLNSVMSEGLLRELMVDGIISGVGGILIFLPNIIILFFWIALLEDSGYMSRAAFLMDRMMSKIGLHGRAFIPMIMGLGCNVPAVMATRTIEDPTQRRLTILLIPLVPCAARLPLLVLLCGTFFPENPSLWMFILFFFNIAVIFLVSQIAQLFGKQCKDAPFLLEMPPYRTPTPKSILNMLSEKAMHFIEKAGTVILAGTIIVWVLTAFPRGTEIQEKYDSKISILMKSTQTSEIANEIAQLNKQKENELMDSRYMSRVGHFIHPVMAPLGFTWRETVSLIPGFLAKESVVSTLAVLYKPLSDDLSDAVRVGGMNKLKAFVFMLFTLLYIPCIATVGVVWRESDSIKFTFLGLLTYFVMAYVVSFGVLKFGNFITVSGVISYSALRDGMLILIVAIFSIWYLIKTFCTTISGKSCDSCKACSNCSNPKKDEGQRKL